MSYYGKFVGTAQPLLFGGYESGPRVPRQSLVRFFGDDCFGRSSYRRRCRFGFFVSSGRSLKFAVKHVERNDGMSENRVEPGATVCRDSDKAPPRLHKRGQGPRVEAVVPPIFAKSRSVAKCLTVPPT